LFLDEVGELNPVVQAKLLRVLQEHEFERVGGRQVLRADIRVIAASNRDLADAAAKSVFRQDLYYRLNVVSLTMPPLRERREDIPLLAGYFIARHREKTDRRITGLSESARACITSYAWPGNVRELENAVQHALILGSSELIMPEDLPESVAESESGTGIPGTDFHQAVKQAKRKIVMTAIGEARGDMNRAAKSLGIHPTNLYRLVRMLDLKNDLQQAG
jgi:Nif-specific regulatory protein